MSAPGADSPAPDGPRSHSSASLARSSALMASGTLVSRLLGLVRLALLAGAIGVTTQIANIWQTANTLPNTLYILLAGGVLNVVFVPQLTRALAREDRGRDLTDRLITLALTVLFVLTALATAGAWLVTKLYAISWTGEQLALAVALAYLCLPQIFFYGAYALLGQILNAQERFGYYMWAPVANNIVAIAGLVVFSFRYPDAATLPLGQWSPEMIWLLGGTATLGIVVQAAVLFEPVRRSGFRYRPRWGFRGVGLGAASRMAMWTLAVIAVSQLGLLLASNVLNRAVVLQPGVPGKFVYDNAFLIFILPHSLIATSLLTAMLPQLSRAAAADDRATLSYQYRHGLRLLATAMVPIAVAMIVLAPEVTALLLLLSGSEATEATAQVVMILTLGLVPYGMYLLSQRIFHAYQEGRPPFQLQLVITGIAIGAITAAAFLPPQLTAFGVAGGQAAGQLAAAVLGVMWVRRRVGSTSMADVRRTYLRAFAAALISALPTLAVQYAVDTRLDGKVAALATLVLGGLVFVVVYAFVAHRLGVRELAEVAAPLLRRVRGRRAAQDGVASPVTPTEAPGSEPPEDPRDSGVAAAPITSGTGLLLDPAGPEASGSKEPQVHGIDTGKVLGGRYALEELLARRDDTLDYWSAHDQTLDRLVAVTVLPASGVHEETAHAVLDSARRTAGVDDPRLVRVLDVGLDDGVCWIVEEGLSEAISLASLVAEHPLPAEEARRIVGEAASGLESARRRGLHHLYLNPHAVLRTREGSVKISGVGVASAIEQTDEISAVESSAIDTSDLMSLLYTGLTGRWPGEEIEALRPARRLADGTLPAPSEVVGGIPGDLDALCRSVFGVESDGTQAPSTPGELAKVLAPWPSEVVQGEQHSLDAPLEDSDGGAYAALSAGSGAAAAATAAHPHEGADSGADDTDDTGRAEGSYYRTTPSGAAPAGDYSGLADAPEEDRRTGRHAEGSRASSTQADADRGADDVGLLSGGAGATADLSEEEGRPRQRYQSSVVLALIAAIVVVAMFLAYGAIQGLNPMGGEAADGGQEATSEEEQGQSGEEDESSNEGNNDAARTTEEPTAESTDPIEPASITSHDPGGDGDENNELTDLAIDGDPSTSWNSRTYLADNWGNLKDGVGLALDLGESQSVSEVDIDFPEGDYAVEVYVGDEVSRSDSTRIGVVQDASEEVTVTADDPVEGQYVLVWFTDAWDGPNGEIVYVSEVVVR
ncbi:MAG TPA: murein biosynthesis integral membrane protein MurJ [Ornithinimicrobium sp.]|uniref:murein biosynthesis integral membrane protein MurJ n=1 Tax=Ornithinimicrobium sp. TaxID=1977084 RepID=UPI002B4A52DF|nr:murein biosynthesis integral membrane protein MurJ [Ornithinimicrobium sp.]HKJ12955.1 murein biosynthesis integral membrane protein MurJ [Ornithinimicrobium sp.]